MRQGAQREQLITVLLSLWFLCVAAYCMFSLTAAVLR